ncbi:MAG: hypothetical protein HYV33_05175 [Candidatus Kerfeldbacteria bacterium]|nr:hypothetical protein [Candidatus Kerfeldbacteria bacterium]
MKNTILSEKDHQLIEKALLQYGRIVDIAGLMTLFQEDYSEASAHNRINLLAKTGWLRRIKQGLYIIIDSLTARGQTDLSLLTIANALMDDSYVSLAQALNYYQMFDQYSATIVSVTTKGSKNYFFDDYTFKYAKVKSNLYFGFTEKIVNGKKVRIAEVEKALLDYLYLSKGFNGASVVFEKLRDYHQDFNLNILQDYASHFGMTMARKVGFMLDQLQLDSTWLYNNTQHRRGVARFTVDSKLFNAKWRLYYDDRIIG